jgi:hypothetical protein
MSKFKNINKKREQIEKHQQQIKSLNEKISELKNEIEDLESQELKNILKQSSMNFEEIAELLRDSNKEIFQENNQ